MKKADIGMIGLAVMGENLAMNMESKGFRVAAFDIDEKRVSDFEKGRAKGKNIIPTYKLEDFVDALEKPRKIMMMIRAGSPVDSVIDQLIPLLDQNDIIIDGGNSNYQDSIRRTKYVEDKGLLFIGSGVSGGEEGALIGPSIMPGGSKKAWKHIEPIFKAIAADVDGDKCCTWIGDDGAGHFVKMVHNGIEYGDIQLITEAYHLMKDLLNLSADEMHEVFVNWNQTELDSYLIEITGDILKVKDEDGLPLVDKILDTAGQKGTGKWTAVTALEEGVPLTLITEAVHSRFISSLKEERVKASKQFPKKPRNFLGDKQQFIEEIRKALYAAKIVSYTQGYDLMRIVAQTYKWDLNYGDIALIWRGGCIIRSAFLNKIKDAYQNNPKLENMLMDQYFAETIKDLTDSWRKVIATAVLNGIPTPAMASALNYFDSYTTENLPANLLQAQRDYFGAHTYERKDKPRGEFFHTNWTGRGGDTSSTTYNN
ncbi:decarboxylating NADP(+)-dependent phosphogluconate dehydrogenase [Peloplasma aerotolerans]|uniref:6-phosphogluconate dehydrogenase, decarboxylating n=1 Tax=Peloplasma aerotolerans TaxID=3044389 RepID=A0AAW6UAQ5_9MOLU|nr:decarboxylating NADP(+)-dependent phosphogluconate dehydrogenase [Mariniplasma sp. M4Ah]MDI6453019.1 decarboxylating NADP(+)-dependent phosphogluconate dehydrogenase [Mariniplasma sp. M4Ah]